MPRDKIEPSRIEVIDDMMTAIYSQMTGAEKLARVDSMYRFARTTIMSSIARQHPDWDEQMREQETVWRLSHGAIGSSADRRRDTATV